MPRFVALLRGVNVGKANRVPMADFRALLAELGYTRVVTLLNSGNAVFCALRGSPAKHATKIAAAIARKLKVEVPVIVKSATELAAIVAENTLAAAAKDPSRLLVAFVQEPKALRSLSPIGARVSPPEKFVIGTNAAYLSIPSGIMKSKAAGALLGRVGTSATTRNWATVLKMQGLASEGMK